MSSYARAAQGDKRPFIMRVGKNYMSDLIDGGGGYPGDYPGRVYYVNNITGLSTNDGLSWEHAFDEVSSAITAAEAYRNAASNASTSSQFRNVIYVQGTGTAYAALTALPAHCDLVGLGADPRGNGAGIVIISSGAAADAVDSSVTVRGLNVYNIQFSGGGAYYSLDATALFRCRFENCTFMNCTSGVRIVTGGGLVFKDCLFGGDTAWPTTALAVGTAGGNFNQCVIEDCVFTGSTTGFSNGAYLANQSVMRRCMVYGGTTGVSDTSAETNILGNMFYFDNFVSAGSDAMSFTNNGTKRAMGNYVINNATATVEAATIAEGQTT